jgi:Flp pilus assembly protein TadG
MLKSAKMNTLKQKNANVFKRFLKNSSGSLTPMMGLAAIPFFLAAGAAIDMSRVTREQTAFYGAVDSAALAIAADDRSALDSLSASQKQAMQATLEVYAQQYLDKNYKDISGGQAEVDVDLTITGQNIKLDATIEFPMTIMAMAGVDTMTLKASSTITKAMRPIEMVMVMDTTGSMASNGKITGAKDAAKKLLETLYQGSLTAQPRSEFIRTALVPFAGAVRLNPTGFDFNMGWIDTTGLNPLSKISFDASGAPAAWNNYYAWGRLKKTSTVAQSWNGCVEARARGTAAANTDLNVNDVAPSMSAPFVPATIFPAYFVPDVPGTQSNSSAGDYGYNYIPISGTAPNEYTGLPSGATGTGSGSFSAANLMLKQENYRKYDGRIVGTETVGSTTGPWAGCAATPIVPMTYDRATVEAGINAMQASGPTLIAEGVAWGYRVASPGEPFTKVQGSGLIPATTIAEYSSPRWKKYMVLMTDGDNDLGAGSYGYNNTTYSAYGFAGEPLGNNRFGTTSASAVMTGLDNDMLAACARVKAAGIALYVTSFGSGVSATTKTRLQACSSGAGYYTHAAATSDLVAFFDHIGKDVLSKSIYVSK